MFQSMEARSILQADFITAQRRADQDAYRRKLDRDAAAHQNVRTNAQLHQSTNLIALNSQKKAEATGFMIGRQRNEEQPPSKKELQEKWRQELAAAAALPSITVDRRPFPHRAYTPVASPQDMFSLNGVEAAALARRADVRRQLSKDRNDVIDKLQSPSQRSPSSKPPIVNNAVKSGLVIGPGIEEEKALALARNHKFMTAVQRDLQEKAAKQAELLAHNLAVLSSTRQASMPRL